MRRRDLIKQGVAAAGAVAVGSTLTKATGAGASALAETGAAPGSATSSTAGSGASGLATPQNVFKLDYAPHFGMFRQSAGEDPLDQLRFMADEGFRSLEDNGMRDRPVELQEAIAAEMQRLNMRMGVFVAHTIGWSEPNLTSGDPDMRQQFLDEITASVDVARRVNAL